MSESVEQLLAQMAQRGSWIGGGSAAALAVSIAAALLEKLALQRSNALAAKRLRATCLRLVRQDAVAFARVIRATRAGHRRHFASALQEATRIQRQVRASANELLAISARLRRVLTPRFQSDLQCAVAIAKAAGASADAFIETNQAWLADQPQHAQPTHRVRRHSLQHAD